MAIDIWTPFRDLLDFQRDAGLQLGTMLAPSRRVTGVWTPTAEIFARGDDMVVRLELAGMEPKDVDISVADDVLTVSGQREQKEEVKEENYYRCETSYGKFQRSVSLPKSINADDIKAHFENGVLEIVVPKAAANTQPVKVPIEGGTAKRVEAEIR